MKARLLHILMILALAVLMGCAASPSPTAIPVPPTATPPPPTETPAPTATFIPPTQTSTPTVPPTPTVTPIPPTPTPIPPTPTPLPATDTVCASGCDFATIQAAIDYAATADGVIIEVIDPIHTEAGIVVNGGITVTIRGLSAAETVVQAHETLDEAPERVFLVEAGATVTLEKMTIRHGKPSVEDDCGGGIRNFGTLTLKNCTISDNTANGGGGICNSGPLTIINSTVNDNTAHGTAPIGLECGNGGGIKCGSGTLVLVNSTIKGNQAGTNGRARGGGIHIGCGCTAVFTNTTISNNHAIRRSSGRLYTHGQGHGGGIHVQGVLRLVNCTISDNSATGKGDGVYVRGRLDYVNTIIAGNAGRGGNCVVADPAGSGQGGTLGTNINNMVTGGGCDAAYSDDPMLGPLADNGGDTSTHALLPGSPAIDAITVLSCTLPTDQRWAPRPVALTFSDTPCDIGAFEMQTE
jgi:hypothetical protein